jgi:hypothetical protein
MPLVHVELKESYPMPPPNYLWILERGDKAAAWYDLYKDRFKAYEELVYPRADPNVTPEVHYID